MRPLLVLQPFLKWARMCPPLAVWGCLLVGWCGLSRPWWAGGGPPWACCGPWCRLARSPPRGCCWGRDSRPWRPLGSWGPQWLSVSFSLWMAFWRLWEVVGGQAGAACLPLRQHWLSPRASWVSSGRGELGAWGSLLTTLVPTETSAQSRSSLTLRTGWRVDTLPIV